MTFLAPWIAALVAVLALTWNVFWSVRASQRAALQRVAEMRISWLEQLRNEMSEIVSMVSAIVILKDQSEENRKRRETLNQHAHRALLLLNMSDQKQTELAQQLLVFLQQTGSNPSELAKHSTKLQASSRTLFKQEWEKIKSEIGFSGKRS